MKKIIKVPTRFFILGAIFLIRNRFSSAMDKLLSDFNITTQQWFMSILVHNLFDSPPSMKEVAEEMGCSHQNAKQVALKLQEKGLANIIKDPSDKRRQLISLTPESDKFWDSTMPAGNAFFEKVFKGVSEDDLETIKNVFLKVMNNTKDIK